MDEPQDADWLIWSNEHGSWWMPAHRGYTIRYSEAGRYSFKEAIQICRDAGFRRSTFSHYDIKTPNECMMLAPPKTKGDIISEEAKRLGIPVIEHGPIETTPADFSGMPITDAFKCDLCGEVGDIEDSIRRGDQLVCSECLELESALKARGER